MKQDLGLLLIALSLMLIPSAGRTVDLPKDPDAGEPPGYCVACPKDVAHAEACEVDKPTYIGWRAFQLHCFQCHGPGGIGTTFAPSVIDLMNQHVDYARFSYVMKHGYTGRTGAMPTFEKNNAVLKDLGKIYGYLRARADGALPVGRPKRLKTPDCPATALTAASAPATEPTTSGAPPTEPMAPSAPAAEGSPPVSRGVDAIWLKQLKSRLLVVEAVLRDIRAQVDALEPTTAGAAEPAAATEPAAASVPGTETPTPDFPWAGPRTPVVPGTEPPTPEDPRAKTPE